MANENNSGNSHPGTGSENKGHQGGQGGYTQDGHRGHAGTVQPGRIDGGYQGPTSENAPQNPPSGGSSGSKK